MNILVDFHHSDLLEAMHLLMEDRLGIRAFIPTGHEWWDEGYWRFGQGFGDDRLAQQFLVTAGEFDGFHSRKLRLVTLTEARQMDWFAVMATVQDNQQGFARFAREKGAQFLVQVGNTGQQIAWELNPLVINTSEMPMLGRHVNIHQEFDKDGAFAFTPYTGDPTRVASFVNLFPHMECYPLFEAAKLYLPGWTFDVYGHGNEFVKPTSAVAERMRTYAWIWHDKVTGDGYGHVIHDAAAVGRPLIGHGSHYRGKLAADLWEDGVTCVDLDRHTIAETTDLMRSIDPEHYRAMCREIRSRIDTRIDYVAEASRVAGAMGL